MALDWDETFPSFMLVFLDETFRSSLSRPGVTFGALCGVAISEGQLHRVASDIYQLKYKHFGAEFARDGEIKGKDLLKNYVFGLEKKGITSKNLSLAIDLLSYMDAKGIKVFGCVCFDKGMQQFKCADVVALDQTFRHLFERIDMFVKIKHPGKMAKIIFDDRDFGTNKQNATAIANFFLRSAHGLSLDSIIKTPFFAISQSQNIGLQLADFATTVVGLRFMSHPDAMPYFDSLKRCFYSYQKNPGHWVNSLKIVRPPLHEKSTG